jgi:hypothetical protein
MRAEKYRPGRVRKSSISRRHPPRPRCRVAMSRLCWTLRRGSLKADRCRSTVCGPLRTLAGRPAVSGQGVAHVARSCSAWKSPLSGGAVSGRASHSKSVLPGIAHLLLCKSSPARLRWATATRSSRLRLRLRRAVLEPRTTDRSSYTDSSWSARQICVYEGGRGLSRVRWPGAFIACSGRGPASLFPP